MREMKRGGEGLYLRRWWAPGDVVIVLGVVALSVFLILQSVAGAGGSGLEARVSANGKEVARVSLREGDRSLTVEGFQGRSTLEVRGGRVRMVDSACPDKLCVHTGWISRPGESIVCLPNRVVIEIEGGEGEPDVVNR
ncbi:MAG: NusG domain II-containing protein [Actinobacteria bacterium]|nr:NusG domain II-containing protein [Actinomycetota bacterium]